MTLFAKILEYFPESNSLLSLDSEELLLVVQKRFEKNQLAFAVMLKYFQLSGHYPSHISDIPDYLIEHLSKQLAISTDELTIL